MKTEKPEEIKFCDPHQRRLKKHKIKAYSFGPIEDFEKIQPPWGLRPILTKVVVVGTEDFSQQTVLDVLMFCQAPKEPKPSQKIFKLCDELGEIYAQEIHAIFLELQNFRAGPARGGTA
jgi:hypothetical protein